MSSAGWAAAKQDAKRCGGPDRSASPATLRHPSSPFHISVADVHRSVATSCRKVHHMIASIVIVFTPSYICLSLRICLSCASIDRAIIGSARQDGSFLS
jgi:hypothetical protein